jgi:hypothetical protein
MLTVLTWYNIKGVYKCFVGFFCKINLILSNSGTRSGKWHTWRAYVLTYIYLIYGDQQHTELHRTECSIHSELLVFFPPFPDESLLKPNASQFLCSNNISISRDYVCDLRKDCPEGEDEEQDCGECRATVIATKWHYQFWEYSKSKCSNQNRSWRSIQG